MSFSSNGNSGVECGRRDSRRAAAAAAGRDSRSIRIATMSRMTELFCELQQSRGGYGDDRGPG